MVVIPEQLVFVNAPELQLKETTENQSELQLNPLLAQTYRLYKAIFFINEISKVTDEEDSKPGDPLLNLLFLNKTNAHL